MPTPNTKSALDASALLCAVAEDRDKGAFGELFRRYAPRLSGWFAAGGLKANADELTQEVMLRVWRKATSYDPQKASVSTWIFAIARNARIDHLRRKRVQIEDSDPALVADERSDVDQAIDVHRETVALREALDSLPEAQSSVVRAAYFEHKTFVAIASEQKVPLGTVKSRVRLAFVSLRKAMGGAS